MRALIEYRFVISLALSCVVGVAGLNAWPFPHENPILGLIQVSRPMVYASFCYAYATIWFSTPFFLFNIVFSVAYIFLAPANRAAADRDDLPGAWRTASPHLADGRPGATVARHS